MFFKPFKFLMKNFCTHSIVLMSCFKWGNHTSELYSRIGRTKQVNNLICNSRSQEWKQRRSKYKQEKLLLTRAQLCSEKAILESNIMPKILRGQNLLNHITRKIIVSRRFINKPNRTNILLEILSLSCNKACTPICNRV